MWYYIDQLLIDLTLILIVFSRPPSLPAHRLASSLSIISSAQWLRVCCSSQVFRCPSWQCVPHGLLRGWKSDWPRSVVALASFHIMRHWFYQRCCWWGESSYVPSGWYLTLYNYWSRQGLWLVVGGLWLGVFASGCNCFEQLILNIHIDMHGFGRSPLTAPWIINALILNPRKVMTHRWTIHQLTQVKRPLYNY